MISVARETGRLPRRGSHSGSCLCLDAQPTEEEREVWNQVDLVLRDSESILMGLREYKGASQEIRDVRNLQPLQENPDYTGKPALLIRE